MGLKGNGKIQYKLNFKKENNGSRSKMRSCNEMPFLKEEYSHVTSQRMKWTIHDTTFQKICACNPTHPDVENNRPYGLSGATELVKLKKKKKEGRKEIKDNVCERTL